MTGYHDLVVHDYGAGRRMISLHAEVPADGDLMEIHDAIDLIERRLSTELDCHAVIHMDPVATDDLLVNTTKAEIVRLLTENLAPGITIHDFRMVPGLRSHEGAVRCGNSAGCAFERSGDYPEN